MIPQKQLPFVNKQKTKIKPLSFSTSIAYCIWAVIAMSATVSIGANDLSVELTSGNSLAVDSNKGCLDFPHTAYVSFEVYNTIQSDIDNLSAMLVNFTNPLFGLAGGQVAVHEIGTLAPGDCKTLFWYIYYDCSLAGAVSDVAIKVFDTTGDTLSQTVSLTTLSTISAGAGGRIMNNGISDNNVLGDTLKVDIEYSVGNIKDNSPIIFQPAGNLDFDAQCYQLVATEVMSSEIADIQVGDKNLLYYESSISYTGNSHLIALKYSFIATCINGDSTTLRGYSATLSGGSLKRYNVGNEEASSGATLGIGYQWIEAEFKNSIAFVSWETIGLLQGDCLTIERSVDGFLFNNLGRVEMDMTLKTNQVFVYKDNLPLHLHEAPLYYRIRHTDQNGIQSYSKVQKLTKGNDKLGINLYPNPVENFVNVSFENLVANEATIKIFNLFGKEVYQHSVNSQWLSFHKIPVENLPTGKYILQVLYDQDIATKSFLKQ